MKILCYGDSNTWGFSPYDGSRFSEEIRWPGVFRRCLGEEYVVVEDGLNGRTLCSFGMEGDPLNGSQHFLTSLTANQPLALAIIYLGINDLFVDPHLSVDNLVEELQTLLETALNRQGSTDLLVLPPLPVNVGREYHEVYHEQIEKSFHLAAAMNTVVEEKGCFFLDPSQVISASRHDGVHIEAEEHIKLGLHLCMHVRKLYGDPGSMEPMRGFKKYLD